MLPFDNLSHDQANANFAVGVQDEILTDLANIADLKVISRPSIVQYKIGGKRKLCEIGQQLGVAHVLEGGVQRAGNRVSELRLTQTPSHWDSLRGDRFEKIVASLAPK